MLNSDGAVPTLPVWTTNGFFSLNTRPGLTLHRRHYTDVPRLTPSDSIHLLKPLKNSNSPDDQLLIPSNEIRKRVLGSFSGYHHLTPDQVSLAHDVRTRREGLNLHQPTEQDALTHFDSMLPLLQRKAWVSFPNSLKAPIPFGTVRDNTCEADLASAPNPPLAKRRKLPEHLAHAYCRGNPLAHFRSGNEKFCVLTPSGRLDSINAYRLSTEGLGASPAVRLKKYTSYGLKPNIITFQQESVTDITALPYYDNDQTIRLLAATSNSICLARISSDGALKWEDHLDVPRIRSSALNPVYPDEFSVLSSDGLFNGTADRYHEWQRSPETFNDSFRDVQCVSPEAQFRQVEYGTHPRTLLLASRNELVQVDFRAGRRELRNVIFDLRQNRETQARDSEIGTFCFAPNSDGFRLLLATRASLVYLDTRRPENPLLDWSLVLPSAPDKICAVPLNPVGMRSDLVVLASSRLGLAEVYHAVHTGEHESLSPFHKVADEQEPYGLPKTDLVWSDLPLRTSGPCAFQDDVDGIKVMNDYGHSRALVLQWSGRTGLTLYPFNVAPTLDWENGIAQGGLRTEAENSVNLRNSLWSLGPFSNGKCRCDRFPVSRSVPGSYLHSRVKRLLLRDVIEVRKRICSAEADDTDNDASTRVPRAYMQDLVSAGPCDGERKSAALVPKELSRTEPTQPDEPAKVDDTADRETIIGEAALLRSQESDDSDNPEGSSPDFIDAIGSGCLFDELSRSVRSGFGHHPMPLGVSTLKEAVLDSPLTSSHETVWHTQCEELHSVTSTAVSTTDTLPSWLCTTVYFTEEAEKGESFRSSAIPESSQYGILLKRMHAEFFD